MSKKTLCHDILLVSSALDSVGLARFPYLLHKAGCRVTLLSPMDVKVNRSRFVSSHLPSSKQTAEIVLQLKELLNNQPSAFAQVIIGDELILEALAPYQGETWLDYCFPVDHRTNALNIILSKHIFYHEMVEAGLAMPYSKVCQGRSAVEEAIKHTGYPVMLKLAQGCAGWAVRKIHNSNEFETAYSELTTTDQPLLVQQFCEGQLGATDILFDHGVPICWQSSYILECWPTSMFASSARRMMQHPDVEHIITEVGRITGFHGFASVDWIQETHSNRLFLLEINPRPTPAYHLDNHAGVDFSHSFAQLLSGQPTITPPKPIEASAPLIKMFPQGLYWAVGNRNWRSFIQCWQDAPWNDFLLLLTYTLRFLKSI